jgi:hypothetical protein
MAVEKEILASPFSCSKLNSSFLIPNNKIISHSSSSKMYSSFLQQDFLELIEKVTIGVPPVRSASDILAFIGNSIGLDKLNGIHGGALLVSSIFWISFFLIVHKLSFLLLPENPRLTVKQQVFWSSSLVGIVWDCLSIWLALPVLFNWGDQFRKEIWDRPYLGYCWYTGQLYALVLGYYVYDIWLTLTNYKSFGPSFTLHAIVTFVIYAISFVIFIVFNSKSVPFYPLLP